MAGAASSSSSSENYDVFLSFRGEDTRRNFISHLYTALLHKQIRTYKDNITLEIGDEVWPALVRAIENSYICIVVFSKDYASSTWCLNELTQILDCKQEGEIIPVFYEIEPRHVRHQTESYQQAFEKHEKELDGKTVSEWKASLKKAANFSGFDSQSKDYSDESNFIGEIVKKVLQKLSCKYPPNELAGLFGFEVNISYIESSLQKAQTIGIWGMGGIGKTTLARAVFDKHSRQYDGCCFLANVREESGKHGLHHMRIQLLSELLDEKDIPEKETSFAMSRLKRQTVLIVLDDVDDSEQLQHLIGDYDCLRSDSRLIVTTRNKHVLISRRVQEIYEVCTLKFKESIELFSMNAFKHNHPKIGFEELTRKAVAYAGGVPLALKVLGSSLCSKERQVWESALKKLKSRPNMKIQDVLRWSYDGLEDTEKKIFLDIACFFKGERKSSVISILDACDFFATVGIETLVDRALITIDFFKKIQMRDLIEEMGKEIVREEANNECGKRSRLWDPKEICDVLQHNKESDLIEGIILDTSSIEDLHLNTNSFTKMCNLRFFKFYDPPYEESRKVYIPSHTKLIFNRLSYFQWDGCPLQSLPSTSCYERLVELHMPNSHVEKLWDGVQDIVNLKIIDLSGSKSLIEFPNLSNSSNLESIDLKNCANLCNVDLSNLCLSKLHYLDLSFCIKLQSLLSNTPLKSLVTLEVEGCSSLREFSLSAKELDYLDLRDTTIEILSPSIGNCRKLEYLYLPVSLKNLPNELSNLRSLQELFIHYCSGLQHLAELPPSIQRLEVKNCENLLSISCPLMLVELDLSCCPKLESLLSETPLKSLKHLNIHRCSSLKEFSVSSEEIEHLDLRDTTIEILSPSIGNCRKLEYLYLPVSLKNLPNELSNLRSLQELFIHYCSGLQHLAELPPSIQRLEVKNCENLLSISCPLMLVKLDLSCCPKLESLLSETPLKSLKHLNIHGCSSLKEFSVSLEEIEHLELRDTTIKILSSSIGKFSKLEGLYLLVSLKNLSNELSNLRSLRKLFIHDCSGLQHLAELPPSIQLLEVKNCENLLSISCPLMLVELDLFCCPKLESLLSETPLKSLKYLNIHRCSSLKEFSVSSEEIEHLELRDTTIEILPSSIRKCSKLESLYLPVSLKNISNELSSLRSLLNLNLVNHKELDTGNDGLQSLKALDLSGCCNLSHFLYSSSTLSSLEILKFDGSNMESLPSSIIHLSKLRTLSVQNCLRLQHLPKLPPTIQFLKAKNCIALVIVSILMDMEVKLCLMDFLNCVKLDQDSLFCVQKYLDFRIVEKEAREFNLLHRLKACFPGNKIPSCFLCRATQRQITIEIPPCSDIMGFTFCIIISPDIIPPDSDGFIISCECHFVNWKAVKFQYIHKPNPNEVYFDLGIVGMISEHVCLWSEICNFMCGLRTKEKANNQCTNFNEKVFMEFSFYVTQGAMTKEMNQMIKECGVRPILNKKEHSLDLNMEKVEGCWDIDDHCRKKFKAF